MDIRPSDILLRAAEIIVEGMEINFIYGCCAAIQDADNDLHPNKSWYESTGAAKKAQDRFRDLFYNWTPDMFYWPINKRYAEARAIALLYAAYDMQAEGK